VGGSLDDPKFSVFGVVMQIIGNLLVKAATSPFALLGAVFGGGSILNTSNLIMEVQTSRAPTKTKSTH
jgi:hypothetical protein